MIPARHRRRYVLAWAKRFSWETWLWHRGVVLGATWPVRQPEIWWEFRRIRREVYAAVEAGRTVLVA